MILCGHCGAEEPSGALFCRECGNCLVQPDSRQTTPGIRDTRSMEDDGLIPTSADRRLADGGQAITLTIAASGQRVTLPVSEAIAIGRSDPESRIQPTLDLNAYGGLDQGVSRSHAAIRSSSDGHFLVDLGSTNGTLLNDQRLEPGKPSRLRNGDSIRFGRLLVQIYF
jgi:pSer/pThr/pTyr-binding forkhead associated (FHA) protein